MQYLGDDKGFCEMFTERGVKEYGFASADGNDYYARSPKVKTIAKDGEVTIGGFREVFREVEE